MPGGVAAPPMCVCVYIYRHIDTYICIHRDVYRYVMPGGGAAPPMCVCVCIDIYAYRYIYMYIYRYIDT